MNAIAILALVAKGISVMAAVWENREMLEKAFQSIKNIVENRDTVTEDDLMKVEHDLDAMLDEFNAPMPEP